MGDTRQLYLEYVNNFLTVSSFAEHYGLTEEEANEIINQERIRG